MEGRTASRGGRSSSSRIALIWLVANSDTARVNNTKLRAEVPARRGDLRERVQGESCSPGRRCSWRRRPGSRRTSRPRPHPAQSRELRAAPPAGWSKPDGRSRDARRGVAGSEARTQSRRAAIAARPHRRHQRSDHEQQASPTGAPGWGGAALPSRTASPRSQPAPMPGLPRCAGQATAIRAPPIAWAPRWLPATWHASAPSATEQHARQGDCSDDQHLARSQVAGYGPTIHSDAHRRQPQRPLRVGAPPANRGRTPRVTAPPGELPATSVLLSSQRAGGRGNTAGAASTADMPTTRNSDVHPPTDARSRGCRRKGATQDCPGTRRRTVGVRSSG
jgi:hypothetical protein